MSRGDYWEDDEPRRRRHADEWDEAEDYERRAFVRAYGRPPSSGGVIAVGVIGIITASVTLLLGICMFFIVIVASNSAEWRLAMIFPDARAFAVIVIILTVFVNLWAILALVAGIGVLNRGQWARVLTFVVCGLGLILCILFVIGGINAKDERGGFSPVGCVIAELLAMMYFAHTLVSYIILLNRRVGMEFQ